MKKLTDGRRTPSDGNTPVTTYLLVIKRKFKQRWSTIPPISTKRTIPSLNPKQDIGNPDLAWDSHNNVTGLNQLMRSQSSPLDMWISQQQYIYKTRDQKQAQIYGFLDFLRNGYKQFNAFSKHFFFLIKILKFYLKIGYNQH